MDDNLLKLFFKYQLRQGLFLLPIIIVPLILIEDTYYFVVFILFQSKFLKTFQQRDFHLQLLHITGTDLNIFLKFYNLSWGGWFNLWFVIAQIPNLLFLRTDVSFASIELINFNIILFISFIVGNIISNSDMITIKNSILRILGMSFIFGISISIIYTLLKGIAFLEVTPLVNITFLLGVISTWYYHTRQQDKIKYIQYYL